MLKREDGREHVWKPDKKEEMAQTTSVHLLVCGIFSKQEVVFCSIFKNMLRTAVFLHLTSRPSLLSGFIYFV